MIRKLPLSLILLLSAATMAGCSDDGPNSSEAGDKGQVDLAAIANWGTAARETSQLEQDLLRNNIYVLLDGSGSMNSRGCSGDMTKQVAAQRALARFATEVPADTNLGLAAFDKRGGISERLPLGVNNRGAFVSAVESVGADSGTPLGPAIELAGTRLAEQASRQLGYGEYTLLVVTDGRSDNQRKMEMAVESLLRKTPIKIHTIGFCIDNTHALNQPGLTVYRSAMNASELASSLSAVLAESESFVLDSFDGLN